MGISHPFPAQALVIGSGLPVGREGPAAYLGGCVGTWAWRLVLRDDSERENDRKRLYATLGGAAGIATAFNAPVGGVLYRGGKRAMQVRFNMSVSEKASTRRERSER